MVEKLKIAVFGGTGFIGSNIVKELIVNGYNPRLLVRDRSAVNSFNDKATIIEGEVSDQNTVKEVIDDCSIIIYAIGIIREYPNRDITFDNLHFNYFKQIVDISKQKAIKKIVYVSANGIDNLNTKYQTSKYLAEQYLRENVDNWTIFRPSVVYGNPGSKIEFLTQLKNDIIDKPIPAPLFFRINPFKSKSFFKSNPVHVEDLTRLIVKSIESDFSVKKIYKVGGPSETTWYSMLKSISITLGKNKVFIPIPIVSIQIIAILLDRFSFFPITSSQIKMLKENNICESRELFRQYGIIPKDFSEDSISYLNQ